MRRGINLIALLALLLLTGCQTPRDPGTLVFLIESSPTNLDPRIGNDAQSARINQMVFNSLLRRDRNLELKPDLAESWESSDPSTYIFHLRPDVRFHDGRPLTSADVKFTFDSLLDGSLTSVKAGTYRRVERIEAPDAYTVIFRLREPYVLFPVSLINGAIGIVPEGSGPEVSQQPIGTGPYRFVSALPDRNVILERNEEYFGTRASVARVEFKVVPDMVTRALELQKGSADVALNAVTPDMAETLRESPGLEVLQSPGTNYAYLAFNLRDPILKKQKVRHAIAHAINRQEMIEHLWRNTVRPAASVLPPFSWAFEPDVRTYAYDPLRAEQLLDQAGFPRKADGTRFALDFKTSTEEIGLLKAGVMQAQLQRVGIAVRIRSYDFATFYSDIVNGRFQLYSLRWIGGNIHPDIFEFLFSSQNFPPNGANRGHYENPRLDALLDRVRGTQDRESQQRIYSEVQRILAEDLPYVHLWYFDNVCVYNRRIRNVHLFPAGDYEFVTEVEMEAPS